MTERRQDGLAAGFALAVGLAYLLEVLRDPLVQEPLLDAAYYGHLARALLAGELPAAPWFVDPLYILVRAGLMAVLGDGIGPPLALNLACLAAAAVATRRFVARVAGGRAGLVAALALPLCQPVLAFQALPLKGTLALALLAGALALLARPAEARRLRHVVAAGVLFGLACLTRGNLLLLAPALALPLLAPAMGPLRRRLGHAAALTAAVILPIAPVTAWNAATSGELVLITYNLGPNLYVGNGPGYEGTAFYNPPFVTDNSFAEEGSWRREMARRLAQRGQPADPAALGPGELNRFWVGEAAAAIAADPARFASRAGQKALRFLADAESDDNVPVDYLARRSTVLGLLTYGWGLLVLLAVPGWVAAWPLLRGRGWILAASLLYVAGVSAFFVVAKLKVPVAPLLLAPAAAAVAHLPALLRDARRRVVAAALVALPAAVVAFWPYQDPRTPGEYNLGVVLAAAGDAAGAEAAYREAIAREPRFPPSWVNLASLLMARGDAPGAVEAARGAVAANPGYARGHAVLGAALVQAGRYDEARRALDDALDLARDPSTLLDMGLSFAREGREAEALPWLREAWTLEPTPYAATLVAMALLNLDRASEAAVFLAEARGRFPGAADLARLEAVARARLGVPP